jgi:hypothetical protein
VRSNDEDLDDDEIEENDYEVLDKEVLCVLLGLTENMSTT